MQDLKPWVLSCLVGGMLGLTALPAHAELPDALGESVTPTVLAPADADEPVHLAGQIGLGIMGFMTDKPMGAGIYVDASVGLVCANRWGTRGGVRIAPGAGSWADLLSAATVNHPPRAEFGHRDGTGIRPQTRYHPLA